MPADQPRGRDGGELGAVGGGGGETRVSRAQPKIAEVTAPWSEKFVGGSRESEYALFRKLARDMRAAQRTASEGSGKVQRALHTKMLAGTLEAWLEVDAAVADSYLREGGRYRATVRFSSASSRPQPDPRRDLRGVAIRVHMDEGDCDLLLTNAEVTHVRDAREFVLFTKAMARGKALGIARLCAYSVPRTVQMLSCLWSQTSEPRRSLACETFWSRAPFLLGERPVKYRLRPYDMDEPEARAHGDDLLHRDLAMRLREGPVRFALEAQPFVDEERTPLEDSTRAWPTPFKKLATLTLAQQTLPAPESSESRAIEALRFNPWNTLQTMRPLGSLNRARKVVYAATQEARTRRAPSSELPLRAALVSELSRALFPLINRAIPWHRLPPKLGVLNLIALRERFRDENLFDTEDPGAAAPLPRQDPASVDGRTGDGRYNDTVRPAMGQAGARLGRNTPPSRLKLEEGSALAKPDPRAVSDKLLARKTFIPAPGLNLLAVAWIQFETHDWFAHRDGVPAASPSDRDALATSLGVKPTARAPKGSPLDITPAHQNETTHWWDCSQIYGASPAASEALRGPRGRLHLENGYLPVDPGSGLPRTGFHDNWWIGIELMHTLFAREHNAICEALEREFPDWPSDRLFATARLVNTALIAKVHTVEWTPAILAHPTLRLAMDAHWWGVSTTDQRLLGVPKDHEIAKGIPGSRADHFDVPYALTEEFVSVYRLHPLLPDALTLRFVDGSRAPRSAPFVDLAFGKAPPLARDLTLHNVAYSLGLACAGKMCLHNYPDFLRRLQTPKNAGPIDLAAIDVFRDRERGVPRYNAFRETFQLPRVERFEDLTDDRDTLRALRELYDDVDQVDLLVGLLSETPPAGFGFSDTAFRVFIGMASRRLKSDRFLTDDFREETYTRPGLRWVQETTFKDVLLRHFPRLHATLTQVDNPFAPWPVT